MQGFKNIWPIRPLRHFLTIWWLTLSDTHFALHFSLNASVTAIFGFVIASYFVIAAARTTLLAVRTLPQWNQSMTQSWNDFVRAWPENLTLSYQDGILQSAPPLKTTLPYPAVFPKDGLPRDFAWIDLSKESATASASTSALLTATTKNISIANGESSENSLLWNEVFPSNWSLTKNNATSLEPQIQAAVRAFTTAFLVASFLASWLGVLVLRAVFLIPYAWIAQGFFRMAKKSHGYQKTYLFGLLLLPLVETLILVWKILYSAAAPAHLFWWIWLGITTVIVLSTRAKSQ